jgi:peroxiredoxin
MGNRIIAGIALSVILIPTYSASVADARKPAPNFNLNDSNGAPIKLSDYKGKVVLLNFWATWCHGCGLEIPWFIEFQDEFKNKGLIVVGVSMDDDGWKSVKPYMLEKKVNYTMVLGDKKMGDLYGLPGMPMTLLIDRDGKIANTCLGVVDKNKCEYSHPSSGECPEPTVSFPQCGTDSVFSSDIHRQLFHNRPARPTPFHQACSPPRALSRAWAPLSHASVAPYPLPSLPIET